MKQILVFIVIVFIAFSCKTKEIKWVALGDSITYLNEHKDETGNRVTKGYMTIVTEKLPHISYVNKGFNGWTVVGIASNIDGLELPVADVYTVFLGTNDWGSSPIGTLDDYKENKNEHTVYGAFRVIANKLRSLNDKAKIILITPMQRGDFVYINDYTNNSLGSYLDKNGVELSTIVDAVKIIGKYEGMDVIDLYNDSGITLENMVNFKRLKDSEGQYKEYKYPDYVGVAYDPNKDEYPYPEEAINMTYDGLHPSDKGYQVIASMLIKKMK